MGALIHTIDTPRLTEDAARFLRLHGCWTSGRDIVCVHFPTGTHKEPINDTSGLNYRLTFPDGTVILVHYSAIHDLNVLVLPIDIAKKGDELCKTQSL